MKKTFAALILASLLLSVASSCSDGQPSTSSDTTSLTSNATTSASSDSTTSSIQTTSFSTTVNGIPFGLSPEELLRKLAENNLELEPMDYAFIDPGISNPIKDGRHYNATDYSFYFETKNGLYFCYNADGTPRSTGNSDPRILTEEGLKIGDSISKVESIYGRAYLRDVEDFPVFQYYNGSAYLNISYKDNAVVSWEICLLPGMNHD